MRAFYPRFLLAFIAASLAAGAHAAETLRLRADTWMPFNGEPDGKLPGYAIEVARIVCAKNNITLDYQNMPWGDALKAAAAGKIEAVIGANKDEAAGLVLPQVPIGLPRIALIVRKENAWRYGNLASLQSIRLAVIQDYKYWPALDEYLARSGEPHVLKFSGDHPLVDALARLQAGTVDVVAETSSVFIWNAKEAGYEPGAFRIAYLHEGDPVFFAFAPGAVGQRYARLFDDGIRALRKSGELAKILERYGLVDWE
jgi:polar amino acid transport system substrate-binding protein